MSVHSDPGPTEYWTCFLLHYTPEATTQALQWFLRGLSEQDRGMLSRIQKHTFVYYSKHEGSVHKRNTLYTSTMYPTSEGNKTS